MIKYEMKEADVDPTIHENVATTTTGSGTGLQVRLKVYLNPDNNQYAAASWEVTARVVVIKILML